MSKASAGRHGPDQPTQEKPVVLQADALELGYGGQTILTEIHWTLREGEFWFLIGPNGTGKTTLLRAVLGALRPRSGTMDLSPKLGGGRRIGFVPQRCELKPTLPMTVSDFVRLGLTGTGIPRREASENLRWALQEVGLEHRERADYWSLSGGQRQRALVARGLVRRPDLLILDEPTNGLDLPSEESFLALVEKLNREHGITVVLVTHAIGLAARFATHVALVREGRVLTGRTEDVLVASQLRSAYGVSVDVTHGKDGSVGVRVGSIGDRAGDLQA
jgi:zinc transport system ATP-binding protein